MSCPYNADYFLRGKETGVSLYQDYRWLPHLTIPMVNAIIHYLGIEHGHTVMDFGCARGYTVKAFREIGHAAWGIDLSSWAIANCDPEMMPYVECRELGTTDDFDWIIAKDVLEHIGPIKTTIANLLNAAARGVFAVVPLAAIDNRLYVIQDYEKDVTHIHRLSLATWGGLFIRPGWSVTASYRIRGVKDNYSQYPMGNGFITARRI